MFCPHFFWLEPVLTPAWEIRMAKTSNTLVHSHPGHILGLTPWVKAIKSVHGILPHPVMLYHQIDLGCKSFSISDDTSRNKLSLWPWKYQNNISVWYSGSWWCITILSLIDQRYCPDKHSLEFRTLTAQQRNPFHTTLQLMNMHYQTRVVAKKQEKKEKKKQKAMQIIYWK